MSPREEAESEVRVTLRMPAAVHQRAKSAAERNRRSLNNMLVVLIELGLEQGVDQEANQDDLEVHQSRPVRLPRPGQKAARAIVPAALARTGRGTTATGRRASSVAFRPAPGPSRSSGSATRAGSRPRTPSSTSESCSTLQPVKATASGSATCSRWPGQVLRCRASKT